MRTLLEISKVMLTLMIFYVVSNILGYTFVKRKEVIKALENAYFEGQKDAINKDIRIKLNSDSTYKWIKSPWDDGEPPIFIPNHENTLE